MSQQGTIEKREGSWSVRYRDMAGRQRRQSGFRTKADANRWLTTRMQQQQAGISRPKLTLAQLTEQYLASHTATPARVNVLRSRLQHFTRPLGTVVIENLTGEAIGIVRATLTPSIAFHAHAALRQVLEQAVRWQYIDRNAAKAVPNPEPAAPEFVPFATWAEVHAIGERLSPLYASLPAFGAGTGLRPQEWRRVRVEHVSGGCLALPASVVKKSTPSRSIPLTDDMAALVQRQVELVGGSGLLFPGSSSDLLDMHNFRNREWYPALRDLGIDRRRPYDLRHTFATWALANGMPAFLLSRIMGTSLRMIDRTYGHRAEGDDDTVRALLSGHALGTADAGPGDSVPA